MAVVAAEVADTLERTFETVQVEQMWYQKWYLELVLVHCMHLLAVLLIFSHTFAIHPMTYDHFDPG